MSIGWIVFIAAVSIAALFVIFRPKRTKDNVTKTIVVHGKPARGSTRWVGPGDSRWVEPSKSTKATLTQRSQAARARQRDRVERNEGVDTSVTDALLLATVLDDGSTYETETYVEPERPYVPEPAPYVAPTPTYTAPSHNDDGGRGGYDGGSSGSDSGGGSDGGGGGGGD